MTPEQMAHDASEAMRCGTKVTLVRRPGVKMPPKFPRGKLLREGTNGARNYAVHPVKVLGWIHARTSQRHNV